MLLKSLFLQTIYSGCVAGPERYFTHPNRNLCLTVGEPDYKGAMFCGRSCLLVVVGNRTHNFLSLCTSDVERGHVDVPETALETALKTALKTALETKPDTSRCF